METTFQFSSEEMLAIEPFLVMQSQRAHFTITPDHPFKRWSGLVRKIEEGYGLTIHDYLNDLSSRDLLKKILESFPHGSRNKLSEWLEYWDNRFIQTTKEVEEPLLPNRENEREWWWFRIPINPGDEIKKDLETW